MESGADIKYGNILIVSNRENLIQSLKSVLQEEGYKNRIERQVERAVRALQEIPFDLVMITDAYLSQCVDQINDIHRSKPASEKFSLIVFNDKNEPRSGPLFSPRFGGRIDYLTETSGERLLAAVEQHLFASMSQRIRAAEASRPASPSKSQAVPAKQTPPPSEAPPPASSDSPRGERHIEQRLDALEERLQRVEMVLRSLHDSMTAMKSLFESRERPTQGRKSP